MVFEQKFLFEADRQRSVPVKYKVVLQIQKEKYPLKGFKDGGICKAEKNTLY